MTFTGSQFPRSIQLSAVLLGLTLVGCQLQPASKTRAIGTNPRSPSAVSKRSSDSTCQRC
jgi:hypothetical protein